MTDGVQAAADHTDVPGGDDGDCTGCFDTWLLIAGSGTCNFYFGCYCNCHAHIPESIRIAHLVYNAYANAVPCSLPASDFRSCELMVVANHNLCSFEPAKALGWAAMLHILACTPKHLLDLHPMLLEKQFSMCVPRSTCHGATAVATLQCSAHHLGVHMRSSEHQVHVQHDLIPVLPPVLWLGHSSDRNSSSR